MFDTRCSHLSISIQPFHQPALATDYNTLQQHHNLVFSLGANPAGNLARLTSKEVASVKVTFGWYMLRNDMPEKIKGVDPLKTPSPDHPSAGEWEVAIRNANGLENPFYHVTMLYKTHTVHRSHLDIIGNLSRGILGYATVSKRNF
jgi:hypothetical protein